MNKDLIKDYIVEFQNRGFYDIVERELEMEHIEGKANAIYGPRRAGKTFYFYQLIRKLDRQKTLYLDFEEIFLMDLKGEDVLEIIFEIFPEVTGQRAEYVFLDEIQNVPKWEGLVRTLINRGLDVYITGSSSKLQSKEISTGLRGRTLGYILLPFSFREYLRAKKIEYNINSMGDRGILKRELGEYLTKGGFPEIVLHEGGERVLKEYLELTFYKDFVERHGIKNTDFARYLFNHFIQNFGREISLRSIERRLRSQGLKFGVNTLYEYTSSLEDTSVVFFLKKLSFKPHERELWPKKVYICDNGLSALFRMSHARGRLMENLVFLELLRKTNQEPLLSLYYLKIPNAGEIDFVLKEGERIKKLIQVTYATSSEDVEKREIFALIKGSDMLKCSDLEVITWDYEGKEDYEGKTIKFTPLWKFLLEIHTSSS